VVRKSLVDKRYVGKALVTKTTSIEKNKEYNEDVIRK